MRVLPRRRFLRASAAALALLPVAARAQSDWSRVAVPSYGPGHFVQGVHRHWALPRAEDFAGDAERLAAAVGRLCEAPPAAAAQALDEARERWRSALAGWERLSAVAIGPLLERRSARQIDFNPARPALIERAIRTAPRGAEAMERIGTPAKGLPALEWLLWTKPVAPATAECRYAREVAADIGREAAALREDFARAAQGERDEEATVAAFGEMVNQWVGGLERLRWPQIEKPLRQAEGEGRGEPELPRAASGSTAAAWAAQWQALRAFAVLPAGAAAPAPGAALVPLETYLRGRGLNPAADALVEATRRADRALQGLSPADRDRMLAAARELGALKRLAEAELAAHLQVSLGFSDADGD